MAVQALLFDFNGVLSEDGPLQCAVFQELFEAAGRPLTEDEYFAELVGLSDLDAVERWLGRRDRDLAERHSREFVARAGNGSTVPRRVRRAVRAAARRVPLAIVTGAPRAEVDAVLAGCGLDVFRVLVTAADVDRGKPEPEGYLRALGLLDVGPADAVAIEDSAPGIAAAKAAGVRCVAVAGTQLHSRLAAADMIAPRLDVRLVRRLLGDGVTTIRGA